MLKITHLSASYKGEKPIIENINFTLSPRRLHALIGKNGSGKSTIVKCLGASLPYQGSILLDNEELRDIAPNLRAQKIGILPQNLPRIPISVYELAQMGRSPYTGLSGILTKEDHKHIISSLIKADIYDLRNKKITQLSGGQRQRAYLAMVLSQNTDIIVLDEPSSHMDIKNESSLMKLLKNLTESENKTVLCVMHNISSAIRYAEHIILLECGKVVCSAATSEYLKSDIIEKNFGVQRKITTDGQIFFSAD